MGTIILMIILPNDNIDIGNMIKYIINLMLFVFVISTSVCYAGGTYFPIKITDIQTISQKEHHIHFSLLQKVGSDDYPYPLDDCKTVILHITYQEWEIYDKIMLFFNNLFTSYQPLKQLNNTIATLQQHKNNPFLLSDVEAFQYDNNHHCELFSKNIQIIDTKQYITSQNQVFDNIIFLQPIKQSSNIKYKPKKP